MNEFGDFANIDVDKLLSGAQERFARMQDLQERIAELVGQGQDRDGLVRATYTSSGGLTDVTIDPRAMRKGSQELAETVKEVIREAAADLQRQVTEVTTEALGQDTLLDRDAGKSMSIIVWETEAAMHAGDDLITSAQLALTSQRGMQVLDVQYFEFTELA